MLLQDKVAVIYGASGDVGGATARAFAREGARVFLAARRRGPLEAVAKEIVDAGGRAEAMEVDAFDGEAVGRHADAIVAKAGRLDISFNAIERYAPQGTPVIDMKVEDFADAIGNAARTHFFTGVAAARHMRETGGGVILAVTANVAKTAAPNTGAFGVACATIEAICRQFTVEFGPSGIRVVCLRSGGSPDTRGVGEVLKLHSSIAGITPEELEKTWTREVPLRRLSRVGEVANAAVIMASDYASAITGEVVNLTCGGLQD
jgi:NAD(P)-dependent dehydrogenase (short-subunit alcohol dehydrogenase family)